MSKKPKKMFHLIVESEWFSCDIQIVERKLLPFVKTIKKQHKIFLNQLENLHLYPQFAGENIKKVTNGKLSVTITKT